MIVLIGTKESNIQNGKLKTICCPKCNNKESLNYTIYSKYVHLTMIPLFAVGKIFEANCSNCNVIFQFEDFTIEDQQKIFQLEEIRKTKSPLWNYLGVLLLVGLVFYWTSLLLELNNDTKKFIKKPMIGDVYQLKSNNGYYSVLKIDSISTNNIYYIENDYYSNLPYQIDDVNKPENYSNKKVVYTKNEIYNLLDHDKIVTIKREIPY